MALFLQLEQKGANGYGLPADKTIVLLLSGCAGSFFVGLIPTFSLGVRTWGVAGRYAPTSRRKESETDRGGVVFTLYLSLSHPV